MALTYGIISFDALDVVYGTKVHCDSDTLLVGKASSANTTVSLKISKELIQTAISELLDTLPSGSIATGFGFFIDTFSCKDSSSVTCSPSGSWSSGTAYIIRGGETVVSDTFSFNDRGNLSTSEIDISEVDDYYLTSIVTNSTSGKYTGVKYETDMGVEFHLYYESCALNSISVSKSPTSLSKPGSVTFTCATASCNDPSCPSSFVYTYSASGGGVSASGTGRTATVSLTSAGTCTCTFTVSGCGEDSKTGSASCTLSARTHSEKYKLSSSADWITITSGASIDVSPGRVYLQYNNSYCGATNYSSYIFYKKSTDEQYTQVSSSSTNTTLEASINFTSPGTYNIKFAYGSSSSTADDKTFNIVVAEMVESGKIGETSSPSTTVTSGTLYQYTSGAQKTIYFKYDNNYGSESLPLRILVNNSEISNDTDTSVSGSYTFTSSKSVTVSYAYGDAASPTVGIEFSVSVAGIISGDGVIEINGIPITSTGDNPVVSTYYENTLSLTGLSGYDSTATFTWELTSPSSSSDYVLVPNGSTATLKCLNPNSQYKVRCTVRSYGTNRTTDMYGKYITCISKTIALFDISPVEGEPIETHFVVEDAVAIAPTVSGNVTVKFKWEITDEYDTPISSSNYHTVRGGGTTNNYWEFYMNIPGTFRVRLSADTTGTSYTSYQIGTDSETIVVNKVVSVNQPVQNRYSIVLYNDTYTSIVNRTNSNVLFMDLNFSNGLNSIGKCSFQIVGGNNLKCGGVSSSESLLKTGTNVIVVDNLCPIWMGKITTINNVNINYYQAYTNTTIFNIECDEIIKELSYQYIAPDKAKTVSDKLENVVRDYIIPQENHGTFGTSSIGYAISLSTSSRLTALDSLSSQVGWRYRVRPNVTAFCNTITFSSGTITVEDSSLLRVNDMIIIYDGDTKDSAGMYHAAVITGITSGNHITISRASETLPNGIYRFTNYRGFLVDYRPAYYQDYVPLELNINECAQNVDSTSVAADKFGEVSVFGVGNSGETISSNMRAWMKINPNYTIDNTARISKSYDSTIDTINTLGEAVLDGYTWTRFAITVNGWSFPSGPTINTHRPTIFYKNKNGEVMVMELRSISSVIIPETDIVKFVDQSSTEKTQFIASFISAKADGSPLQPSDSRYADYADSEGRKYVDILSSMPALTNVVFNYMTITSDKVLANIFPAAGGKIMIGDTEVVLTSLSPTGNLTFDWILTEGGQRVKVAPHGHLTDVLVIDNTGTKHNSQRYKYDNPDPDSPYGKYGDVTISIQGAEGYSRMELERLACRYMQYGSNYSDRGSCQVILNAFIKSDYDIGCRRLLIPGDRFVLNKVTSSSGSSTVSTALNYELLSYNVSLNSNMVTVSFGMPFVELNDVIYNMLSNAGMSIMASSSDINL